MIKFEGSVVTQSSLLRLPSREGGRVGVEGGSWRCDDLGLCLPALIDLVLSLLLLLLLLWWWLLLLLVVALVVLGEVRGAQHDEGVQTGHGGGHWSWWWWWWWWWVLRSWPEMEQLVVRLMRLVGLVGLVGG